MRKILASHIMGQCLYIKTGAAAGDVWSRFYDYKLEDTQPGVVSNEE